jgi:hypothetical protein
MQWKHDWAKVVDKNRAELQTWRMTVRNMSGEEHTGAATGTEFLSSHKEWKTYSWKAFIHIYFVYDFNMFKVTAFQRAEFMH